MADTANPVTITPYGIVTFGTGVGLYGTGLGILTDYPQATGTYWSYLGRADVVEITDPLKSAITDAGMTLTLIDQRATLQLSAALSRPIQSNLSGTIPLNLIQNFGQVSATWTPTGVGFQHDPT